MNIESPTLKVRFAMTGPAWGLSSYTVADEIAASAGEGFSVLDAKWGREPTKWRDDGGGWGHIRLTEWERGYIAAFSASTVTPHGQLLQIIERITG